MPKKRVGELLQLNVAIPLWLVLVLSVAGLLAGYFASPQYRDQIRFLTVVIAGAAGIYSAYYVGAALQLKIERDHQQASFTILEQVEQAEFIQVRHFIEKEVQDHERLSDEVLYQKVAQTPNLEDAVVIVLNVLEKISISIRHDYVDENILYEYMKMIVERTHESLRGYIEQLRKQKKSNLFFIEIEKLAHAWSSGKRLSDGRPLPTISLGE